MLSSCFYITEVFSYIYIFFVWCYCQFSFRCRKKKFSIKSAWKKFFWLFTFIRWTIWETKYSLCVNSYVFFLFIRTKILWSSACLFWYNKYVVCRWKEKKVVRPAQAKISIYIFFFIDVVAIKKKKKENTSHLPQRKKRRTVKTSKCACRNHLVGRLGLT